MTAWPLARREDFQRLFRGLTRSTSREGARPMSANALRPLLHPDVPGLGAGVGGWHCAGVPVVTSRVVSAVHVPRPSLICHAGCVGCTHNRPSDKFASGPAATLRARPSTGRSGIWSYRRRAPAHPAHAGHRHGQNLHRLPNRLEALQESLEPVTTVRAPRIASTMHRPRIVWFPLTHASHVASTD